MRVKAENPFATSLLGQLHDSVDRIGQVVRCAEKCQPEVVRHLFDGANRGSHDSRAERTANDDHHRRKQENSVEMSTFKDERTDDRAKRQYEPN